MLNDKKLCDNKFIKADVQILETTKYSAQNFK